MNTKTRSTGCWVTQLSHDEIGLARYIAQTRTDDSEQRGLQYTAPGSRAEGAWRELLGVASEMAFAKIIGLPEFIPQCGTFKQPDVGPFQVRATQTSNGRLILRPGDNQDHPYVLMICLSNGIMVPRSWVCRGAIYGRDGMLDQYSFDNHRHEPCWMVPQLALSLELVAVILRGGVKE